MLNQVNISEECRERLLATDVTAYDIFDEARAEVLAVMEVCAFQIFGRCFLSYLQNLSSNFHHVLGISSAYV